MKLHDRSTLLLGVLVIITAQYVHSDSSAKDEQRKSDLLYLLARKNARYTPHEKRYAGVNVDRDIVQRNEKSYLPVHSENIKKTQSGNIQWFQYLDTKDTNEIPIFGNVFQTVADMKPSDVLSSKFMEDRKVSTERKGYQETQVGVNDNRESMNIQGQANHKTSEKKGLSDEVKKIKAVQHDYSRKSFNHRSSLWSTSHKIHNDVKSLHSDRSKMVRTINDGKQQQATQHDYRNIKRSDWLSSLDGKQHLPTQHDYKNIRNSNSVRNQKEGAERSKRSISMPTSLNHKDDTMKKELHNEEKDIRYHITQLQQKRGTQFVREQMSRKSLTVTEKAVKKSYNTKKKKVPTATLR